MIGLKEANANVISEAGTLKAGTIFVIVDNSYQEFFKLRYPSEPETSDKVVLPVHDAL